MKETMVVYRENGEAINIELILTFKVPSLNKEYVAYTLNDDKESEDVPLFISEYKDKNIKNIPPQDAAIVMDTYQSLKKEIMA